MPTPLFASCPPTRLRSRHTLTKLGGKKGLARLLPESQGKLFFTLKFFVGRTLSRMRILSLLAQNKKCLEWWRVLCNYDAPPIALLLCDCPRLQFCPQHKSNSATVFAGVIVAGVPSVLVVQSVVSASTCARIATG